MKVAEEILRQLGGKRFAAITGAKDFNSKTGANWLEFKIGRNASKANLVKITLTADDDYTMEFIKFTSPRLNKKTWTFSEAKITTIETRKGVFCNELCSTFTEVTGLVTSLPRVFMGENRIW